jgi:hypothetical protein
MAFPPWRHPARVSDASSSRRTRRFSFLHYPKSARHAHHESQRRPHCRDAHRALGAGHNLAAILSVQEQRVVANDYTIRFANRLYQLEPPAWPGERGGKVVIEQRLDGTLALRFRGHYLHFHEVGAVPSASLEGKEGGASTAGEASPAAAGVKEKHATAARSPEEKGLPRPAATHPWRRTFLKRPK